MADVFTPEKRSRVMSQIRGRGNKDTELALAKIFRANRITGWRRGVPLFGKPDFTFRPQRLVVFIDGCFWHGCPKHGRRPKSNLAYWENKLLRNTARDRTVTQTLRYRGWRVLRFWEHDLRHQAKLLARLKRALREVPLAAKARIPSNASR